MGFLAQIMAWLNVPMNAVGGVLLAPLIGTAPGWLSNTIISAAVGVALLFMFKYTSNQRAIGRTRDNIKANMLALKLFKDSMAVTLQSQGKVFAGSLLLLVHAIRPLLVMILPVSLILGQLGVWYQARPLRPGEHTVVTMRLNGEADSPWPKVSVDFGPGGEVVTGPVRVLSKREICWEIKARGKGIQHIVFRVDEEKVEKELAVGDGFLPVSAERPDWNWASIMVHPREKPFPPESPVRSISITYPVRSSWTSGTDWWMIYFFVASMVFALIAKPFLKVKI
ncbi:MAG: hypothetical protein QF662_00410 [Phycisphaerae bacterium]|jgi:uncharacterized membrane protein (DUF106 family)|nr:hypothetical protein [Phycisphaerae bacterium]